MLKCVTECFGRIFIANISVLLPLLLCVPIPICVKCIAYDYVLCRKWLNKQFRIVIDGWCAEKQRNIKDIVTLSWHSKHLFNHLCLVLKCYVYPELLCRTIDSQLIFVEMLIRRTLTNKFLGSMLHRKRWSVSFLPVAKYWKNDSSWKILLNENTFNLRWILLIAYSFKNRNTKFYICKKYLGKT